MMLCSSFMISGLGGFSSVQESMYSMHVFRRSSMPRSETTLSLICVGEERRTHLIVDRDNGRVADPAKNVLHARLLDGKSLDLHVQLLEHSLALTTALENYTAIPDAPCR